MNRIQKMAVFNLITFGIASVLTIIAIAVLYNLFGWPKARVGFAFISIGALGAFSPLIFKKDSGAVTFDERDKLINRTAALGGFVASYLWLCLAGTAFLMLFSPEDLKEFGLPLLLFGGMVIVYIVSSILILIQYGRNRVNG
ncbi:MAG: hypothetical protein A2Y10_10930 [Planctomycetes bacterium GWF2_41_51]|nr:MAG: hypothetical protein A2Y10_10930 [Planctomycetes bacterium GWF2_41_51]HBG28439.1 hypothetical protein [Phycisphaerales bacterium]